LALDQTTAPFLEALRLALWPSTSSGESPLYQNREKSDRQHPSHQGADKPQALRYRYGGNRKQAGSGWFDVTRYLGMRKDESNRVQWFDINWKLRKVRIPGTKTDDAEQ
jgi:hypothetical protein